jgi:hypothetical protein
MFRRCSWSPRHEGVPVALGNTTPSSGCPASLLVRVIRCSLVVAVPLLRLLVSRASDRADSADRDQETSPDESEHPKHCEHTKQRRNGGAGATRIREFSRGQRLSAIGKVDPRKVALSSCSDTWCSRLQCAADEPWSDRQQLGSRLHHHLHHRPRVSASFCEASRDAFPQRATFRVGPQTP